MDFIFRDNGSLNWLVSDRMVGCLNFRQERPFLSETLKGLKRDVTVAFREQCDENEVFIKGAEEGGVPSCLLNGNFYFPGSECSSVAIAQTLKYISTEQRSARCIMYFVFHLSAVGSSTDDEGSNYPGGRDGVEASKVGRGPDNIAEEDRRMEERKLKALNLLSKLHNDAPADVNKGLSNFEDCEFIIF